MRRILFVAAALLTIPLSVLAQEQDLISVNPGFEDMTISIAGFDLKLGPSENRDEFISVDFFTPVKLGMTTLVGNVTYPDTWFMKNAFFGDDLVTLKVGGRRPGALFLSTGASLSCFSFRMADGRAVFINSAGVPYRNGETIFRKSKLKLNYIGVPVSLGINLNRRYSLAATAIFDLLFDARNKLVDPKTATVTHLDNLNRYRCSVELSLMDKEDVGFFVNYGLTPVFLESSGVDAHTISFGLRLL